MFHVTSSMKYNYLAAENSIVWVGFFFAICLLLLLLLVVVVVVVVVVVLSSQNIFYSSSKCIDTKANSMSKAENRKLRL